MTIKNFKEFFIDSLELSMKPIEKISIALTSFSLFVLLFLQISNIGIAILTLWLVAGFYDIGRKIYSRRFYKKSIFKNLFFYQKD
jgi:hypothetical protein